MPAPMSCAWEEGAARWIWKLEAAYISGCRMSDALLRLYNMAAVASGTSSFLHDEGRGRRLMRIHNATI
jgi:hypothetical protein